MTGDSGPLPWEEILRWIRAEAVDAARRFHLPGADRDDLEQDISLRITVHIRRFVPDKERATLETWVRMHAQYEALDFLRRRMRLNRQRPDEQATAGDQLPSMGSWSVEDEVVYLEMESAFRECLEKLPPGPRERYLRSRMARGPSEDLSDVARSLGIGLERLKEVLKATRKALFRCLQDHGFLRDAAPPGGSRPSVSP